MYRIIALSFAALLPFTASAHDVTHDNYLTLDFNDLYEEDADYLAEALSCEMQKDGTCLIPGDQWIPSDGVIGIGIEAPVIGLMFDTDDVKGPGHMEWSPGGNIGYFAVDEFTVNKDGSIDIFAVDVEGGDVDLFFIKKTSVRGACVKEET